MALEIKILDYGDIELESSFLVLGRDCGRTRRVPTYGFLILGGQYPVLVDTGYRDNAIMETLGMRGLQFHENMIENQLARHGVKPGDIRYVCHTHLHIDHAGKDDHFPMNTTVVLNRRELEHSVSGLMHPQYPKPDIQHLIERLHTPGAMQRTIPAPVGDMPGSTFARFVAFDDLVHGWDIASATRQGFELPAAVVAAVDEFARQALTPDMRDGDTFKAAVTPPAGSTPLESIVAFSGRSV